MDNFCKHIIDEYLDLWKSYSNFTKFMYILVLFFVVASLVDFETGGIAFVACATIAFFSAINDIEKKYRRQKK